jgi:hypothetical protein
MFIGGEADAAVVTFSCEEPSSMKAISVKQPWANLIASGEKTIETRAWSTEYRGDLLIVSSKMPSIESAGYALAIVELVDCRPMSVLDEPDARCRIYPGAISWVLRNIRGIKPVAVRGHLGIFETELSADMLVEIKSDDLHPQRRGR